jgi:hypothetical protein
MESRRTDAGNYLPAVYEGALASGGAAGGQEVGGGKYKAAVAASAGQQAEVALLCLDHLVAMGEIYGLQCLKQ